jgi:ribosomal protein S18 acetylase RimI-like enzyme
MQSEVKIYVNDILGIAELNTLLETNNWQISELINLESALNSSWCHVVARDVNNKLIGFVHVLSDGIFHAYILRMIVHPDFRKMGVGTRIMIELMRVLSEAGLKATLAATPGNEQFYEKFGFKRESKGIVAMCIR